MSNTDGGTLQLRNFAQLSARNQRAVVLRSQGVRHALIAQTLETEYGVPCSQNTVNQWFAVGGVLQQALSDYNEQLASYSLSEARSLLMKLTLPAVATIARLLQHPNPRIQLKAAQIILNKYIPDGQKVSDQSSNDDDELPLEIRNAGDRILAGET